jgi:hypothetical protein
MTCPISSHGAATQVPIALIIGHSHIAAPFAANAIRVKMNEKPNIKFEFVALNAKNFQPAINEEGTLNSNLVKAIADSLSKSSPAACFITVGGSLHAVLGLTQHPTRFFLTPDSYMHEALSSSENLSFVTSSLIKQTLMEYAHEHLQTLRLIASILPRPLYFLQPPPPVFDEEYVMKTLGRFTEDCLKYGISSPQHRMAMYRVCNMVIAEICKELSISYLGVPPICLDESGFLAPAAWHIDPVHGNVWYGEQILNQVQSVIEKRGM